MKEKKFLLLTHAFPPFGGGGVQRMAKFAVYLEKENWKATVVAPGESGDSWIDAARLKEVAEVEVIRIGKRNLKQDPIWTKIVRRFFPIDPYFQWAIAAWNLIRKYPKGKWQLIFSSSPPHSTHLAGMWIAKEMGIPWVADFRDHFTQGPEYKAGFFKQKSDHFFEGKFLKMASAIVVNTETNRKEILSKFPSVNPNKLHVIYNGFDLADLHQNHQKPEGFEKGLTHFLYLGGLRGDHIDGTFYHTLAKAIQFRPGIENRIRIHIVGDISRKGALPEKLGLNTCIRFSEPVAYNEVADFIAASDACLTWQRPNPRYKGTIAGKVFDYIGMRKSIFSLGQPDGEIASILTQYGIGISADPSDTGSAALAFLEFHDALLRGEFDYPKDSADFLSIFDRRRQASQLASLFSKLSPN